MLTLVFGRSVSAGYWSGERMAVRRARRDYPCACGRPEHAIRKGELYVVITPDRLASWAGHRYTHRLHPVHAAQAIQVVDGTGRLLALWQPDVSGSAADASWSP